MSTGKGGNGAMKKRCTQSKHRDTTRGSGPEFRHAVAGIKPLVSDYVEPARRRRTPKARFRRADDVEVLAESLEPDQGTIEAVGGDRLRFRRDHVSERTLRRLARGVYRIEDEIDLHGLTAAEARDRLGRFIAACRARGVVCIRVVHGKGLGSGPRGPVLKSKVNAWLRRWDAVLAFVSARIVDGGTGAVYVLLKDPIG